MKWAKDIWNRKGRDGREKAETEQAREGRNGQGRNEMGKREMKQARERWNTVEQGAVEHSITGVPQ